MGGNESNRLLRGALLLTLAGLISKVLSAGYRIPLQNLTGDTGYYVYQQVYPILGMALILALYGFPAAISRMSVDLRAKGDGISWRSFLLPVFSILAIVNGAIFLFLLLNAEALTTWIGDTNLKPAYQFAAFTFLVVPFTALLRGIFQGNYEMKPTAYSQVGEQLVRIGIIIAGAVLVASGTLKLYDIGKVAAVGSIAGGIGAATILGIFFSRRKPVEVSAASEIPWNYYVKTLLLFGIIAALNHMTLLIFQFADAFTMIPGLKDHGLDHMESIRSKGIFDRGQPLIQLGTVLGSSFALAMVPSISKEKLVKETAIFYTYIRGSMLFSFYLAIGATIGLIAIFPDANRLLFQDALGTAELRVLVLSIFFCSMAITGSSILQGLGYIKRTAGFILIAFFMKWIGNQLLVPWLGMMGASLATAGSLAVLFLLVMYELKRKVPGLGIFRRIQWLALIKAVAAMLAFIWLIGMIVAPEGITSRVALLFYILSVAIAGGTLFISLLLNGRAFTRTEIRMLPKSELLLRIHKGRKTDE